MSCDEEDQVLSVLADHEAKAVREIAKLAASNLDEKAAFSACLSSAKEQLTAVRAANRELENLAEEQNTDEGSQRLAVEVQRHHAQNLDLQAAFVQANAQARKNTEVAAAGRRQQLLAASAAGIAPKKASETDAVASSQKITHSLQRTRQLMAQELEHTSATLAAMDNSNERLAETRDELESQRGLFTRSRKLLRALLTSAMLDSLSLYGGLALFLVVVAYIVQKRTLYFAPLHRLAAPVMRMAPGISGKVKPALRSLQPAGRALGRVVRPAVVAAWDATAALSSAAAASATNPETWAALRRQLGRMNNHVVNAVSAARKRATQARSGVKSTTTIRSELQQRNQMKTPDSVAAEVQRRQNRAPDPLANVPPGDLDRLEAERQSLVQHAAAAQHAKSNSSQLGQQSVSSPLSSTHDHAPPKQEVDQFNEASLPDRDVDLPSSTASLIEPTPLAGSAASSDSPSSTPQQSVDASSSSSRPLSAADAPVPQVRQPSPATVQIPEQQWRPNATTGNVTQSQPAVDAVSRGKDEANNTNQHVSPLQGRSTPQAGNDDIGSFTANLHTTNPESIQPRATGNTNRSSDVATPTEAAANNFLPLENRTSFPVGHGNDSTIERRVPPAATRGNEADIVSPSAADDIETIIPTSVNPSGANMSTTATNKGRSRTPDTPNDVPLTAAPGHALGRKAMPFDRTALEPEVTNVETPELPDGPKSAPAQRLEPLAAAPVVAVHATQAADGPPAAVAASAIPPRGAALGPSASIDTSGTAKQPSIGIATEDFAQDTESAVTAAPVEAGTDEPAVAPSVKAPASQEPIAANDDSVQPKESVKPQTTGQLLSPHSIQQPLEAQGPAAASTPLAASSPAASSGAMQQPRGTPVIETLPKQAQTEAVAAGSLPDHMPAGLSLGVPESRPSNDVSKSTDAAAQGAEMATGTIRGTIRGTNATPKSEAPATAESADVVDSEASRAQGPLASESAGADDSTTSETSGLQNATPAILQQPDGSVPVDAAEAHGEQQVTLQQGDGVGSTSKAVGQQVPTATPKDTGEPIDAAAEEQQAVLAAVASYAARKGADAGASSAENPPRYQWRQDPNVGWQLFAFEDDEPIFTSQLPEQARAQNTPTPDPEYAQPESGSPPVRDEL